MGRSRYRWPIRVYQRHPRPKRYPKPVELRTVSAHQMAVELGLSDDRFAWLLRQHPWLGVHPHLDTGRYAATDLEYLKGLLGVPGRGLEHDDDWLAQFQGGSDDRGVRPFRGTDRKGPTGPADRGSDAG